MDGLEEIDGRQARAMLEAENARFVAERPKSTALLRLMDALEDHDDVDSVHANFDVPEEILEKASTLRS